MEMNETTGVNMTGRQILDTLKEYRTRPGVTPPEFETNDLCLIWSQQAIGENPKRYGYSPTIGLKSYRSDISYWVNGSGCGSVDFEGNQVWSESDANCNDWEPPSWNWQPDPKYAEYAASP